ncbi:MAG: AraC family transcriptional regulator [Rudaea sp.]|uniref:AraC family transcriptional regulator n=1 Tax=Rudaea sp. TaxID=2136325 RepID=UPI0039E62F82
MSPVEKALWFIESHSAASISLDDVARSACVSRYHLCRAFGAATGQSVMGYLRGRRLSKAACALADGAADIFSVALGAGYGSHEAFTRAFRDQFGMTPEQLRAERCIEHIQIVEPIAVAAAQPVGAIASPRFENGAPFLLAGSAGRHTFERSAEITQRWQRFFADFLCHPDRLPATLDAALYGGYHNFDDEGNFDYLCAVRVAGSSGLPAEWSRLHVPEQRYAVFRHAEHISTIDRSWRSVWNAWLPASGQSAADAPSFERLDRFDEQRGIGEIELWLAIE